MNLWGPEFFTDEQLVEEIKQYAAARREVLNGGVAVIAGEGRRVEFAPTPDRIKALNADLRAMMYEARQRNLPIGGEPMNAIAVETGL